MHIYAGQRGGFLRRIVALLFGRGAL
jgi:hypothetical protein